MMLHAARRLGAVAVLATGVMHLQQYFDHNVWLYPAIGALFLLNVIGSGVAGIALLAPLEHVRRGPTSPRHASEPCPRLAAGIVERDQHRGLRPGEQNRWEGIRRLCVLIS